MKFLYRFLISLISLILFFKCAKKSQPSGGPKDKKAPVMLTAKPPFKSVNFNKKEIKIQFDEFITLNNLTNHLIISPPLKNPPVITPQGTPTKNIKIKIIDTLKPKTTYIFNFGNAIQDYNEGNKLESFKYIFSTGKNIDSLTFKGKVSDALKTKLNKNVSVLLYIKDSTYTDSIPFKKKPNYVTNTLDSLSFNFTNLRKGTYIVLAIDEKIKDYIFNPKTDKIGFFKDSITLPKDSILSKPILIFKEKQPFKFKRGKEINKGKIQFGFTGDRKGIKIKLITKKIPDKFKSFKQFEENKDTINYWYTPTNLDSLNFIISKDKFIDTITVKLRKKKIDSLLISSINNNNLKINDTVFIETNNPIIKIDSSKFHLTNNNDSIKINFKIKKQSINKIALFFNKKQKNNYSLKILPKGIIDLYKSSNDTLNYKFYFKSIEDYGTILLDIKNKINKHLIIELLYEENVIKKVFLSKSKKIKFDFLEPKEYKIRAIIDNNNNKIWDSGNLLKKNQPEQIIYFPKEIKIRANWQFNEVFILN